MNPGTIKAIFTNLLFVIGVILLIIGFSQGALTLTRIATFENYPLPSFEEDRCSLQYARPLMPAEESIAPINDDELAEQRAKCEQSLKQQREVRQVEDIVSSLSMLFAGFVLALFFKRFILK